MNEQLTKWTIMHGSCGVRKRPDRRPDNANQNPHYGDRSTWQGRSERTQYRPCQLNEYREYKNRVYRQGGQVASKIERRIEMRNPDERKIIGEIPDKVGTENREGLVDALVQNQHDKHKFCCDPDELEPPKQIHW